MIIYIHGFNSKGKGEKYRELKELFPDISIYSPTYDSTNFDTIDQFLDGIEFDGETMFIGCSLGGYLAMYFAAKYDVKSILLNPLTNPLKQFIPLLDKQKDELTEREYQQWMANIQKLEKYKLKELGCTAIGVFVNKDDEVIDYKETLAYFQNKRSVKVFESGGHRFSDLEKIRTEIEFQYYQI